MSLIQEIGSYAGLAAIPGLAILSALYFSQARDVRRLRDWAGRAPERATEQALGGRVVARPAGQPAAQPVAQPAAQPAQPAQQPAAEPAQQPAAQPVAQPAAAAAKPAAAAAAGAGAAASAAGGGGGGTATATPPRPGAATPAGANAANKPANAGAGGNAAGNAGAAAGPPRIPPRVPSASQTSVLGVGAEPQRDPWYRRLLDRLPAPRYLAILLVGILVVGGGIAFGITQLGKDDSPSSSQSAPPSSSSSSSDRSRSSSRDSSSSKPTPVDPGSVNVSVLNGTTTTGLASSTGLDLEGKGYNVINKLNGGNQGAVAESVVEFTPGHDADARQVAKDLDIAQIEPASSSNISLGGPDAEVIVVLGADKADEASP